jgi:hypothetical protein
MAHFYFIVWTHLDRDPWLHIKFNKKPTMRSSLLLLGSSPSPAETFDFDFPRWSSSLHYRTCAENDATFLKIVHSFSSMSFLLLQEPITK